MLNAKQERELCYLIKVDDIKPIEGKDFTECAVVGGWTIMVRKGQFQPGDIGIYFEVDSKVPETEPFLFLAAKHYKIKTQKYKTPSGHFYSQGLLMHPEDFGFETYIDGDGTQYVHINGKSHCVEDETRFLTKELGVTYAEAEDNTRKANSDPNAKYKAMAARHPKLFKKPWVRWMMKRDWGKKIMFFFFGKKKDKKNEKSFPTHLKYIQKSDEERCENIPFILQDKDEWIKTTKIDGTSSLYLMERKGKKFEYWVCSRNIRQLNRNQECYHQDNVYWEVNDKYKIEEALIDLLNKHTEWDYVAIQGETAGCSSSGAKIQGDPHKFGELRFFAYNFITSDKGRWNSLDGEKMLLKYNIPWVPIVDAHYILPDSFEEFKRSADGPCEALGASGDREGFVYRRFNAVEGKINSFKNVSNEYLLEH